MLHVHRRLIRRGALALAAATFAFAVPRTVQGQDTVTVAVYNIKHGLGMDSVVSLERVAEVLRPLGADVITFQEIDMRTERTERVDQTSRLGELLGMAAHFGEFMPYQGGGYGMAVLSRLPVVGVRNHRLPDGAEPRTSLEVEVALPGGGTLSVVGIHFYRTEDERLAQAMATEAALSDADRPVVLAGDFNSQRGDRVLDFLQEGWRVVDKDGDPNTFPSEGPQREIDFVMIRRDADVEVVSHRVVPETVASDHRPLVVTVVVR